MQSGEKNSGFGKAVRDGTGLGFEALDNSLGQDIAQKAFGNLLLGDNVVVESLGLQVEQADFEQVMNAGLDFDKIKRFGYEIFSSGLRARSLCSGCAVITRTER